MARALWLSLVLLGCSAAQSPHAGVVGRVERAQLEADAKWKEARASAHADPDASRALLAVPTGATVRIFLGTWCGDSRREVSRFADALDQAGGPPPFAIEWIAVDRKLSAPGLTEGAALRFVPTFVVVRDGKEVGRVVESSPSGIERDLGALLRGERSGVITGRSEL